VVNHDIYVTNGIQKEVSAIFDKLSALAVSQGMDFVNKHYCQARIWQVQSGNHKPFDAYCGTRLYLILYHNSLLECGNQVRSSLAVPKVPDGVKRSSLDSKKVSIKEVEFGFSVAKGRNCNCPCPDLACKSRYRPLGNLAIISWRQVAS
jgi:hypothetical protein